MRTRPRPPRGSTHEAETWSTTNVPHGSATDRNVSSNSDVHVAATAEYWSSLTGGQPLKRLFWSHIAQTAENMHLSQVCSHRSLDAVLEWVSGKFGINQF